MIPRWKQWINRVVRWFGWPYADPGNYSATRVYYLDKTIDEAVCEALFELCTPPKCKRCAGTNLEADPAGYHCDAEDHVGAPLLCLDCCV